MRILLDNTFLFWGFLILPCAGGFFFAFELKINVKKNIMNNIGSIHYALYDDPSFYPNEQGKLMEEIKE